MFKEAFGPRRPTTLGGRPSKNPIKDLAELAESFYSWHLFMRKTPSSDGDKSLQYIIQMCKRNTPTKSEATKAIQAFSALLEELDGGMKTMDQIAPTLSHIVDNLIEMNPKSRLIKQTSQIIEIATSLEQNREVEMFQHLIKNLVEHLTPQMTNIKAEGISRILKKIEPHSFPQNPTHLRNNITELKGLLNRQE